MLGVIIVIITKTEQHKHNNENAKLQIMSCILQQPMTLTSKDIQVLVFYVVTSYQVLLTLIWILVHKYDTGLSIRPQLRQYITPQPGKT